ncbi:TPA: sarcinarray family MAST domain-containing protein [Methanosarcinaceae archaeon]|nr:sarcinarray family MAST domain-containing protein [Methanosarcinaceae archaeon]
MNMKFILLSLSFILLINTASAYNPYGEVYEYDLYFNDKLLDTTEVPKPILKINEPFTVRIDFKIYKKCELSVMLNEIEKNNYYVITGSTQRMNVYTGDVVEKNSTKSYEWTVAPTENWAGGSLPIDLVYQINDFETGGILVNSGFTIAYPHISTEYYEGETPTTPESPSSETKTSPESTPAFTTFGTFLAVALAASRR